MLAMLVLPGWLGGSEKSGFRAPRQGIEKRAIYFVRRHRHHLPVELGNFLDRRVEVRDDDRLRLRAAIGTLYYAFKRYMVGGLTGGTVKS